jgi:hypothetical protein
MRPLNLIRCNGHHAKHPNRLENTIVPADTCHIHRITERYQKFSGVDPETFAEATAAYNSFETAVLYMSESFGIYVSDDPYGGRKLFAGP